MLFHAGVKTHHLLLVANEVTTLGAGLLMKAPLLNKKVRVYMLAKV
jgi:hypothetical protein